MEKVEARPFRSKKRETAAGLDKFAAVCYDKNVFIKRSDGESMLLPRFAESLSVLGER